MSEIKFNVVEEMAKTVAEKALDEYVYQGKTIRQWVEILKDYDAKQTVLHEIVERLEECSREEVFLWAKDEDDWDESGNLIVRKTTEIHGYAIDTYEKAIEIVKEVGGMNENL